MLIETLKKVEKRRRYLIQSFLVCAFVGCVGFDIIKLSDIPLALACLFIALVGTCVLHYPNIKRYNIVPSVLLPLGIISAGVLLLSHYSGLSFALRAVIVLYVGVMYYLISLMDNIFLVVYDRDESIPLFRVATSWSQIFHILIAIPIFACIYKLDYRSYESSSILFILSFIVLMHQVWIQSFDSDTKRVGVWEMIFLSLFGSFLVSAGALATSYIPAEAFLRALFAAAILLFSINYVNSYLKNELSKKLIAQYISIVVIFLALLVFITT